MNHCHRNILLNPTYLKEPDSCVKVTKLVQMIHQFVILAPWSYHGAFNVCYNIAKKKNFAAFFSLPGICRSFAKNKETARPFGQGTVPVEKILWMEAEDLAIHSCLSDVEKLDLRYKTRLEKFNGTFAETNSVVFFWMQNGIISLRAIL